MKMHSEKRMIGLVKERLVKAVNQVLGIVRRSGRSRKVGLALVLMVLLGGRASVRNAAETFGLDYANLLGALGELDDAWGAGGPVGAGEGSGCHHRRHRGPQGVLQGEGGEPPLELLDLLPRPREVREGRAPHCRRSEPRTGRSWWEPSPTP